VLEELAEAEDHAVAPQPAKQGSADNA